MHRSFRLRILLLIGGLASRGGPAQAEEGPTIQQRAVFATRQALASRLVLQSMQEASWPDGVTTGPASMWVPDGLGDSYPISPARGGLIAVMAATAVVREGFDPMDFVRDGLTFDNGATDELKALADDRIAVEAAARTATALARDVVLPALSAEDRARARAAVSDAIAADRQFWRTRQCPEDALAEPGVITVIPGFLCRHPDTAATWTAVGLVAARAAFGLEVSAIALELTAAISGPDAESARAILGPLLPARGGP